MNKLESALWQAKFKVSGLINPAKWAEQRAEGAIKRVIKAKESIVRAAIMAPAIAEEMKIVSDDVASDWLELNIVRAKKRQKELKLAEEWATEWIEDARIQTLLLEKAKAELAEINKLIN